MRVLQVVNVRWYNATAWYGIELARLGMLKGHESMVVGLQETDPLYKAQGLHIPFATLPLNTGSPFEILALFKKMRALVESFRPDVVNCHRGEAFILWGMLKHRLHRTHPFALVRTRGDQRLPKNNLPNRVLHGHIADAVIATNSRMAGHLHHMLRVPEPRLHVVYGGVDITKFTFSESARAAIRSRLGYTHNDIVIGLLGRFDAVKGQRECIRALARLVEKGLPVKLLLIGFTTATLQEEVEGWIRESGMEKYVRITGKVDDVPGHLSAIDIGVVASLWSETIARAALEIMACDRPLLSTDVGVMPDLLPPEALCAAGDELALETLLERGAKDEAFLLHLREHNRKRMKTLTSEVFWSQTETIYQKCLEKHGRE